MGEWGRKFGAFVLGLGVMGSESTPIHSDSRDSKNSVNFSQRDNRDNIESKQKENSPKKNRAIQESVEKDESMSDFEKSLSEIFLGIQKSPEDTNIQEFHSNLEDGEFFYYYLAPVSGENSLLQTILVSQKVNDRDNYFVKPVFNLRITPKDDGTPEYIFESPIGKSVQQSPWVGRYESDSLFSIKLEGATPTTLKDTMEKFKKLSEYYPANEMKKFVKENNVSEQRILLDSIIQKLQNTLGYCDTLNSDDDLTIPLTPEAHKVLEDRLIEYQKLRIERMEK